MCFEDKVKPSLQMLKDGEETNPHGGGIAWINKKENVVEYRKGLSAQQINDLINNEHITQPYIIHFRIDSVGNRSPLLNHPFPITDKNHPVEDLKLSGKAKAVLFHNGHWSEWKDRFLSQVINSNIHVGDKEEWSDSRTMAMLASIHGLSVLNAISGFNKISVLTPKGIERFGDGWVNVEGATCSNDNFTTDIFRSNIKEDINIDKQFDSLKEQIKVKELLLKKLSKDLKKRSSKKQIKRIKRRIERLEKSILELRNKQEDLFQNTTIVTDDLDWYENEYQKQENQNIKNHYNQYMYMYDE
jgi:hypothetical protein